MTTLNDLISNIDENFPVPNVDNPSQVFRDNFFNIKYALQNINENPYQLSIASAGGLGGVKIGYGLTMNSYTGVLSVSQIVATTDTLGFIRGGTGISIDPTTGVTSVTPGSDAIVGGVKSDSFTTSISNTGTITATGQFNGAITGGTVNSSGDGVFAGDGVFGGDIRTNDGNIRARDGIFGGNIYAGAVAFSGDVYAGLSPALPTGYVVNFNTLTNQLVYTPDLTLYTLPAATTSTLGGVKIGNGVDITVDGTISVNTGTPYILPLATYSAVGGVQIGTGLVIDGNGLLSTVTSSFDGGLINQALLVNNYTQSYSTLSGALIVQGGAGIAGTVWVGELSTIGNGFIGGRAFVQSTTTASSTSTGALVVKGGVGVGGDLYVGGTITADNVILQDTTFSQSAITTNAVIQTTDKTPSVSTQTGALIVGGGAGIGQNLFVGGGEVVWGDIVSLNGYFVGNRIEIPNTTISDTFFQTTQIIEASSSTDSISTTTGAIVVKGGIGVGGSIRAGNIYSNGVQLVNFNTGTLVATSVYAQTFNTSTLVATSVFAQTFNTGTLVTNAVNQVGGTVRASVVTATNSVFVGSQATTARFPNALAIVSSVSTGQQNESGNIGIVAEVLGTGATRNAGVYGVGYSSGANSAQGVIGEGHVIATGDTAPSVGVRGYAEDTHSGGNNVGLYSSAINGANNYALWMNAGNINSAAAQSWTLLDNSTSALSIDSAGQAGILKVVTTNGLEGVTFAGYIKSVPTTVSTLPSASTVGAGARSFVTDSVSTTFLAIAVGGGSNGVPVVSNGTNWLVG